MHNDIISIRKFEENDINNKIKWINDSRNNQYLHYDLPLEYNKTLNWYNANKNKETRYDAVIEFNGISVGLIGLLNIDEKNRKAEYYITLGENEHKRKGVAFNASIELIKYAFNTLNLNKIYLYTETQNISAQKLFEKIGFRKEGKLVQDLIINESKIDRYIYGICKEEFFNE